MRYKLQEVEATFKYGALSTDDANLTCVDIKKWYKSQGGEITPETEIDFTKYFPEKP